MIGLYFKEGIKWLDWTSRYNYLVTRYEVYYYYGEIPDNAKEDYLTDEGVGLVRFFMKRIHGKYFYFEGERSSSDHRCYSFYLGLDNLDYSYSIFLTCGSRIPRYIGSYSFKHIVEHIVNHYIGQGEAIAGVLLENGKIKIINHNTHPEVEIDISDTYLPIAYSMVRRLMKGRKWVKSVTWANGEVIKVNGEPVVKEE